MIRLAVLGDIGSGKSYVAKLFGYPVFNADKEVHKLYKTSRRCYNKLKKTLPKYIHSFPIKKNEVTHAIITNKENLKKIVKIIHPEIKIKLNKFLRKKRNSKIIILDIPLFLENKISKKKDILIFVDAKRSEINKKIKKRNNFNLKIVKKFKKLQLPIEFKKKKAHFIIKNNFKNNYVKKNVKVILKKILKNA
tara:strand:+ start:215 stop:793 length:579 start_codon:yes stop_codon:yes gene_type:complete